MSYTMIKELLLVELLLSAPALSVLPPPLPLLPPLLLPPPPALSHLLVRLLPRLLVRLRGLPDVPHAVLVSSGGRAHNDF